MKKLFTYPATLTVAVLIILGILAVVTQDADAAPQRGTVAYCMAHSATQLVERSCVVRVVFGRNGRKAVQVFTCESGLNPHAKRGQYLGIAQMGAGERRKYGHGRTVLAQAKSAKKYFDESGWAPWDFGCV